MRKYALPLSKYPKPKAEIQWSRLRAWVEKARQKCDSPPRVLEVYCRPTRVDAENGWPPKPRGVGPINLGNLLEVWPRQSKIDHAAELD